MIGTQNKHPCIPARRQRILHHMVRRIVSTLREVGQINESSKSGGRRRVEAIDSIFAGAEQTGPAAPARGCGEWG